MSLKSYLKRAFPRVWYRAVLTRKLWPFLRRSYGYHERSCPICRYGGRFVAEIHFPDIVTLDAVCPNCGSLPRNRLIFLANQNLGIIKPGARLLHFAPEEPVQCFVRPIVLVYKTADLYVSSVDLTLNIEHIEQSDNSWDCIICSHVLEHVDHKAALKELYRILAPGGVLIAAFPVIDAWDEHYENDSVTSEYDRAIHFGKSNHVRRLGRNIRKEIENAGFRLVCFSPISVDVITYGLIPGETLFIASKL